MKFCDSHRSVSCSATFREASSCDRWEQIQRLTTGQCIESEGLFPQVSGSHMEEEVKGLQEAEEIDDSKETVSPRHSRTDTHRIQRPWVYGARQAQTRWGSGARKGKCTGATIINQVAISNQSRFALQKLVLSSGVLLGM